MNKSMNILYNLLINVVGFMVLQGHEQNSLGNLLALWLISGVFAGVALGWLW